MASPATEKYPAPALARGLTLLLLLQEEQELSLEELHRRTGVPKSSLLRFLETLEAMEMVVREREGRAYRSLVHLTRGSERPALAGERVSRMLAALARDTGLTAEWYVPSEAGLLLARRAEPPRAEATVSAQTGFIRTWEEELDAVACVGNVFFRASPTEARYSGYVEDGVMRPLPKKEIRRRMNATERRGWDMDPHFNANGVRRTAAILYEDERPAGILAVAEPLRPGADRSAEIRGSLLAAVRPFRKDRFPAESEGE